MSGGKFQFAYARVLEFAAELDEQLKVAGKPMPVRGTQDFGDKYPEYSERVNVELRHICTLAKITAGLMKEVEWLYSGDTSEDSFLENVRAIGDKVESEFDNA